MNIVLVHVPFLTKIRQTLRGHEKLRDAERGSRGSVRSPRCHGDRCLSLVENSWSFTQMLMGFSEMMVSKSSWEFSLKTGGHDVFKKLYFLRDIPGRQKKKVSFFKKILLFNGLLFFKRPS